MKNIIILLLLILLQSCNTNRKDTVVSKNKAIVENKEIYEIEIPIYDFSELEPLLNKKNDTTYVVNFWATWCKPCIKELPFFEQLGKQYASKNVKVILVSLDFPDKLETQVIPFVKARDLKSEVVLLDDPDANNWIPKVDKDWSGAIPATLIYNDKGRNFYEKSFTFEELETELNTIL